MKRVIVISLGGSLIVPEKMDVKFLEKFKQILRKNYHSYKFVIVCGGGTIARKYISALKEDKQSIKQLSLAGIMATRMNAQFMMQFFGNEANDELPEDMRDVKNNTLKNSVIICGALRFAKNSTSDTTAAKLARYLGTDFINITNVDGLYTADPRKDKNAKLIRNISWADFEKMALKIKHAPGQHFVLDQNASMLIKKHKIRTYIIGKDLRNLENVFKSKKFEGTLIEG